MIPRPTHTARALAAAAAVALAACGSGGNDDAGEAAGARSGAASPGPALARLDPLPTPAGPGSAEPNLTAGAGGVYLSWLEPSTDGYALRLARWDGTAWGETRTVLERDDLFVNWADFPALATMEDGTLAVHWLEKSGPDTYAYDVRMALSRDGGASWGPDIIPHRDGIQAEHGFVALLPLDGDLGLVWLDGRETVEGRPMTLRFTTVSPAGELGPETVLDTSTCDCCQTAMAMTADGPVVAYRDRSADEVRDIYVTRRVAGEWTEPRPVHRDGWIIPACPVNGPALAARAERVALAWFTGAPAGDGAPATTAGAGSGQTDGRVLVAFSDDAGATFGPPVRVDDGGGMGRVAVELVEGDALVTWLERTAEGGEVRVRRVAPGGVGPARTIAGTAAERASGFPRSARMGDRVVFAWTEPGAEGRVRAAVATLPSADAGREDR